MKILLVILPTFVLTFIALILAAKQLSKSDFRCTHCSNEFKPSWTKLVFVFHSDDYYEIRCPKCQKIGCKIVKFPENT